MKVERPPGLEDPGGHEERRRLRPPRLVEAGKSRDLKQVALPEHRECARESPGVRRADGGAAGESNARRVRAPIRSTWPAFSAVGAMPPSPARPRARAAETASRASRAGRRRRRTGSGCRRESTRRARRPPFPSSGRSRTSSAVGSVFTRREHLAIGAGVAGRVARTSAIVELFEPRSAETRDTERRRVGPVRVVDDDADRACGGEVRAQPVEAVEDRERRVAGRGSVAFRGRRARQARGALRRRRRATCSSSARSSSEASASGGSNSWRTTPNAKSRSSSVPPRARSTRIPSSAAVPRAAASSAVLPIPAGPRRRRTLPRPVRACASADLDARQLLARSRSAPAASPGRARARARTSAPSDGQRVSPIRGAKTTERDPP